MMNDAQPTPKQDAMVLSLGGVWEFYARPWLGVSIALVASMIVAAAYFKLSSRSYRASTIMSLSADAAGVSGTEAAGVGLSAISSMLGTGTQASWRQEALAVLKSRVLSMEFVRKERIVEVLTRGQSAATDDPVRVMRAANLWLGRQMQIDEDRTTGLVTVSVEWTDPQRAASLANAFVAHANSHRRKSVVADSTSMINEIRKEMETEVSVSARSALVGLMERQLRARAVARAETDFAYRVIDPAQPPPPEQFVRPQLVSCGIFGGFFGLVLGTAYAFFWWRRRS